MKLRRCLLAGLRLCPDDPALVSCLLESEAWTFDASAAVAAHLGTKGIRRKGSLLFALSSLARASPALAAAPGAGLGAGLIGGGTGGAACPLAWLTALSHACLAWRRDVERRLCEAQETTPPENLSPQVAFWPLEAYPRACVSESGAERLRASCNDGGPRKQLAGPL